MLCRQSAYCNEKPCLQQHVHRLSISSQLQHYYLNAILIQHTIAHGML